MRFKEALEFFGVVDGECDKKGIKSIYRKLSLRYHPDKKDGDERKFKVLGEAYLLLQDQYDFICNVVRTEEQEMFEADPRYWQCFGEEMETAFLSIWKLEGIVIEICGVWIWLTGETYPHKNVLKSSGCLFSGKKKAWYWRTKQKKSYYSRGKYSLDQIRSRYGSLGLNEQSVNYITG
jgi:hypothetical protein